MFQTGSQINPALGRVDYTPYMQGAVAGAQSIGQGIASLGQSVGSGMEAYAKRKKENKMMEASLKANINSLEGLSKIASSLSPQAQEQFNKTMQQLNDPSVSLTDKVALSEAAQKTVGELINFGMQEKQKQDQALSQQLAYDAAVSGQSIPLIYPQSVRAPAAIQSLAIQNQMANTAETLAKAKSLGVTKPPRGFKTREEARVTGQQANPNMEIKVIHLDDGSWDYNPVLPAQSNADVAKLAATAEADSAQILYKTLSPQVEKFAQHKEAISDYDAAIKEIEEGKAFSGAGANFKVVGAKAVQLLGGTQFDGQLAANAALSTILANRTLTAGQMLKGSMSDADRVFLQDMAGGKTPTVADLKKIRQIYVNMVSQKEPVIRGNIDSNFADFTSPQAKAYQKSLYITGGFDDGGSPTQTQARTIPNQQNAPVAEEKKIIVDF